MQSAELPEQLTESYRKTERELSERLKRSDRKTIGFIAATKLELISSNDTVVYEQDDTKRIGRVVAFGGDTVSFSDSGELIVNGNVITEEVFYPTMQDDSSNITYPYTVPEDTMFILNDYRTGTNESFNDSRKYDAIDTKQVKGKIILLVRRRGF